MKCNNQKISEDRLTSIGKKRMGLFMRQMSLQPIDAFFGILEKEIGSKELRRDMKIKPEVFVEACVKSEFGIDKKTAEQMAADIAKTREDGMIDAVAFMDYMTTEDKDPLHILRDIIYLNGLKYEDILKTMNIPKATTMLDYFKIRDGLKRVDPTINKAKAEELAM